MNDPKTEVVLNAVTLDRLVDGELSPAEYRRVLLALEQQPAAWRKCAEAFLQAQAWQRDFGELRSAAEVKPPLEPAAEVPIRRTTSQDWLRMLFVAAASFLLAFFIAQGFWRTRQGEVAVESIPPIAFAPTTENPPTTPLASNESPSNLPLGTVQLAVNRTGTDEPALMEVPVYDPTAASEMVKTYRPALPEDLVEGLQASGHRIDRQGQYISVPLDDGRQMMVPVESYRIVPVSRPSY